MFSNMIVLFLVVTVSVGLSAYVAFSKKENSEDSRSENEETVAPQATEMEEAVEVYEAVEVDEAPKVEETPKVEESGQDIPENSEDTEEKNN